MHHIIVLGAGYAGTYAAGRLARRLHRNEVAITVVNAEPYFAERMRFHQIAAGRDLRRIDLADVFAGTGVRLRVARATALDVASRTVTVTDGDGDHLLSYDTLLYTLGSGAADHGVPGVREHAHCVATRPEAQRLRERLDQLGTGARALVVGGGLTAIEAATEIAESRPGLRLALATDGLLGGGLSPKARGHLKRAFDRFGIEVHEHTPITAVEPGAAVTAEGTHLAADVSVWAAGFAVGSLAAESGLAVAGGGRVETDGRMRSVSHPEVYAAGDSSYVVGEHGQPPPMSCAAAGFTGQQAVASIIGDLTGSAVGTASIPYLGNCVSLGARDAIYQQVDGEAVARAWSVRGRTASRLKEFVVRSAAWNVTHPWLGVPARRRRLAPARPRSAAPETTVRT